MMQWVREYLISLVAAGIVCGILVSLTDKNKPSGAIVKMLGGIFLAITLVAPLVGIQIATLGDFLEDIRTDSKLFAQQGSETAYSEKSAVIKRSVETYILDKATGVGAEVNAVVSLSDDDPPIPCSVSLTGSVSPYQKRIISGYIAEQLGITEDHQEWN